MLKFVNTSCRLLPTLRQRLYSMDGTTPGPVEKAIRTKLTTLFQNSTIEITNESGQHQHHPAMREQANNNRETHFSVKVVSNDFEKKPTLQRHRMIHKELSEEFANGLHALTLSTKTEAEVSTARNPIQSSRDPVGNITRIESVERSPFWTKYLKRTGGSVRSNRLGDPIHETLNAKYLRVLCRCLTWISSAHKLAMRNSSHENGNRPTLPSIWDLFRDELSLEPASRYSPQSASSSVHTLPSGRDRRYDGWVPDHPLPAYQDHSDPSLGPSSSLGETPLVTQQQVVPHAPGPTFYQPSIPQPYYSPPPPEVHQTHGDRNLHHNLGTNPTPAYRTRTPSTENLAPQGGFPQTTNFTPPLDIHTDTNPGANYHMFRCIQPLEFREETPAKYECQYCGKTFIRPSTLRIHLNSHTGEKPFVCPVDDCGRGFSVLSNMRRHTRVHAQPTTREGTAHAQPGGQQQQTSVASNSMPFHRNDLSVDEGIDSDHP